MIYASKTPRDLNHDPLPWRCIGNEDDRWRIPEGGQLECDERVPRPEFDHPQHNEPNPILTTLRLNCATPEVDGWDARIAALYFLEEVGVDNVERERATPDHVEHARRVLTRLARLEPAS
jgi:hypothetical protein